MKFEIQNWADISAKYDQATLFMGNGASIAISDSFNYTSLLVEAEKSGNIKTQVAKLFGFFKTNDFELILRLVWQAAKVNQSLEVKDDATRQAYIEIRDSLIRTVQRIHPSHDAIARHLPKMHGFVKNFQTVLSFNYDLILYWMMMHGNGQNDDHGYKDCFLGEGIFSGNWARMREPIRDKKKTTLVFYPHGNLALSKTLMGADRKILTRGSDDLLESIIDHWKQGEVTPLFVSEGTAEQKIDSISQSRYLGAVLNEVYRGIGESIVIYGWGIGEQDQYVLSALRDLGVRPKNVAISVYKENQDACDYACRAITKKLGTEIHVQFFRSDSPDCWIY